MLEKLEKEIAGELDRVIVEDKKVDGIGDGAWTSLIKAKLCAMGHQKGFLVSADWCDGADTEKWMFDMVWTEQQKNPERFLGMPLAMELEWAPNVDAIVREFKKLLVVKAQQKVMVFQQATPENVRNAFTILEDRIRCFQPRTPEERYLLAGFAFKQGVYMYESA